MSEALRLAELLECSMSRDISTELKAANELRRLSAELEECQAQRRASFRRIEEQDAEIEKVRKDAERYRWLRKQHWSENLIGVVVRPKDQTMLGSLLPCGSLLDDTVDHMKSTQEATQKGQQ